MVEGVFGQIKTVQGATRFMRRGLAACESKWKLICAAHNLLKLWRAVNKKRKAAIPCLAPCPGCREKGHREAPSIGIAEEKRERGWSGSDHSLPRFVSFIRCQGMEKRIAGFS